MPEAKESTQKQSLPCQPTTGRNKRDLQPKIARNGKQQIGLHRSKQRKITVVPYYPPTPYSSRLKIAIVNTIVTAGKKLGADVRVVMISVPAGSEGST